MTKKAGISVRTFRISYPCVYIFIPQGYHNCPLSTFNCQLNSNLQKKNVPSAAVRERYRAVPNGVAITVSVRNALSAATRRRNNPRSTPIAGSCRGLFHGTVGVNHWVTSISLTKTRSLFIILNCFRLNSYSMVSKKFMLSEDKVRSVFRFRFSWESGVN